MEKIKVVILDDDPSFIQAVSIFLNQSEDIIVIAGVTTKREAINVIQAVYFDLLLLDINLGAGQENGIEIIKELRRIVTKPFGIIIVTSFEAGEYLKKAAFGGAIGYVEKKNILDLPKTIRDIYHGNSGMAKAMEELHVEQMNHNIDLLLASLTETEIQVLKYMAQKMSNRQIAMEMGNKSIKTIKNHITNIYEKTARLGIDNRKKVVEIAKFL
jgi:NarL family two-component system response regulator LiaR